MENRIQWLRWIAASVGAFTGYSAAWACWGIVSPGDSFANGSVWVGPTLTLALVVGAWVGYLFSRGRLIWLVGIAGLLALAFWLFAPDGWWTTGPG